MLNQSDLGANTPTAATQAGERAEARVLAALGNLPAPWQFFHAVEWRNLSFEGEVIGEADVLVFHPQHGLVFFEVKAGAVQVREGRWFYASGLAMKQSPFSQARRNRYALADKLAQRLGRDVVEALGSPMRYGSPMWCGRAGCPAPRRLPGHFCSTGLPWPTRHPRCCGFFARRCQTRSPGHVRSCMC